MKKTLIFLLFVTLLATLTAAQISRRPEYVKCSELAVITPTGTQKVIELVTTGGQIRTYSSSCKNIHYLYEYSCDNLYPATPVLKRCSFMCRNDGCTENFAATVASSPYGKGLFSKTTTPYKPQLVYEKSEPELVSEKKYPIEYLPFAKNFVCEDSDDGTVGNVFGEIKVTYRTGIVRTYQDTCRDKFELTEYRCDVSNPSVGSTIICKHGCLRGACKPQTFQGHYGVQR